VKLLSTALENLHSNFYHYVVLYTLCDLVTLTFNLPILNSDPTYQLTCSNQPFSKFEHHMPIHSWVTSHDVSHWLPLTMHF